MRLVSSLLKDQLGYREQPFESWQQQANGDREARRACRISGPVSTNLQVVVSTVMQENSQGQTRRTNSRRQSGSLGKKFTHADRRVLGTVRLVGKGLERYC